MTRAEFCLEFERTIEASSGSITPDTRLADIGKWDSMAFLTTIAMIDNRFGINVSGNDLQTCVTVEDIIKLLGDKVR